MCIRTEKDKKQIGAIREQLVNLDKMYMEVLNNFCNFPKSFKFYPIKC